MTNRDRNVSTANETAHAAQRAGGVGHAPILLTERDLEAVAAAGGAAGGIVGSRNHPAR